jgi:CRISPR/Cas system CSM-associated protein Csm2 small subunit
VGEVVNLQVEEDFLEVEDFLVMVDFLEAVVAHHHKFQLV